MNTYTIEFWYRFKGGDEKDLDHEDIVANSPEEACEILKKSVKNIISTKIIKINGEQRTDREKSQFIY